MQLLGSMFKINLTNLASSNRDFPQRKKASPHSSAVSPYFSALDGEMYVVLFVFLLNKIVIQCSEVVMKLK